MEQPPAPPPPPYQPPPPPPPPPAAPPPYAPQAYAPGPGAVNYASFWMRLVAAIIDGVAVGIVSFVAELPFGILDSLQVTARGATTYPTPHPVTNLIGLVIGLLYTAGTMTYWQATPGMRLLRLRITDLNGQPIGAGRAVGRYFAAWLSACICLVGYLMQPFTARRQTLHDMIAGTIVVQD